MNSNLTALLDAYRDQLRRAGYAKGTQYSYARVVRLFLETLPEVGDVDDITQPAMVDFVTAIEIEFEEFERPPGATHEEWRAAETAIGRRLSLSETALRNFGAWLQKTGRKLSDPAFALEPIRADDELASPERRARHEARMRNAVQFSALRLA